MIRGITKVRNEEHIITRTLDNWAQWVDAIHVYDDASEDGTRDLCRAHPAVVEVISSDYLDPVRQRAEWYNRAAVLKSAQRFNPTWICYFDADEWLYDFDSGLLQDPDVKVITCRLYDVHITPEDVDVDPRDREWVDSKYRSIPFFYRNSPALGFSQPDQRIMHNPYNEAANPHPWVESGVIKHYGKGWSVEQWERKVAYYSDSKTWPQYAEKWAARKGKAVKVDYKSDSNKDLVQFQGIREKWSEIETLVAMAG